MANLFALFLLLLAQLDLSFAYTTTFYGTYDGNPFHWTSIIPGPPPTGPGVTSIVVSGPNGPYTIPYTTSTPSTHYPVPTHKTPTTSYSFPTHTTPTHTTPTHTTSPHTTTPTSHYSPPFVTKHSHTHSPSPKTTKHSKSPQGGKKPKQSHKKTNDPKPSKHRSTSHSSGNPNSQTNSHSSSTRTSSPSPDPTQQGSHTSQAAAGSSSSSSSNATTIGLAVGLSLLGLIIVGVAIFFLLRYRRRQRANYHSTASSFNEEGQPGDISRDDLPSSNTYLASAQPTLPAVAQVSGFGNSTFENESPFLSPAERSAANMPWMPRTRSRLSQIPESAHYAEPEAPPPVKKVHSIPRKPIGSP